MVAFLSWVQLHCGKAIRFLSPSVTCSGGTLEHVTDFANAVGTIVVSAAHKAELIAATASYVVTAINLFNTMLALRAASDLVRFHVFQETSLCGWRVRSCSHV
jgi:hypothetical protein